MNDRIMSILGISP